MAIVVDKYRYTVPGFPIYFCMSQDPNFVFYSMILVLDILLALTIGLSFVMLWVVHKVYIMRVYLTIATNFWPCMKEFFELH